MHWQILLRMSLHVFLNSFVQHVNDTTLLLLDSLISHKRFPIFKSEHLISFYVIHRISSELLSLHLWTTETYYNVLTYPFAKLQYIAGSW